AQFFQISQDNQHAPGLAIKDLLSGLKAESQLPFLKELQERQQKYKERGPNDLGITGIPTHFLDIDKMLNGFNNSNLMILAARPAMGKSAIALNFAENLCFKNNIPTAIFSLEMSASQLLHRLISSQAEVESEKILNGSLSGNEYQRIVSTVNMMQKHTLIIDDQSGLKITDLRARARRLKEAYNIGFIVIDYLQLVAGSGNMRSQENRQNEIAEISRMLKNLARELNIPILCAAQLSRKVEERQGHRPMMSDLRESGSIEADADIIMMLFRRDYYDKYDKPGLAELIVAKNRHGPVGDITLTFRKEVGQFANYTPVHSQPEAAKANKEAFSAFSPE
ncbi:MAG: AAA family ATPase, partial [Chlamydiia bacterium]|nr:AAA family ATPase [Chlamydiia bacterium]